MEEIKEHGPFARTVGVAAIALVLLLAAWMIADVLLLLFGSVLLSLALSGAAEWLSQRSRLSRGWALAAVFGALLLLLGIFIWALAGRVAEQATTLSEELPRAARAFAEELRRHAWARSILDSIADWQDNGGRRDVLGRATGVFSTGLGAAANLVIVLLGTLYFAASPDVYRKGAVSLVPPAHRPRVDNALCETASVLRSWLLGKLLLMTYVGVVTTIGLSLMGVPLAFALGLIAGLLGFIPNFGPLIAFIPAGLLAVTVYPMLGAWVGLFYLLLQWSENYVLTPIVQRKASHLMPATIIFGQIALGVIFGVLGMLFAEPLAAGGQVLIQRLYVDVIEGKG